MPPARTLTSLLLLGLVLGGALLRVAVERPMHTDEAVNAVKLGALVGEGTYRYDPVDYHGPLLHWASAPFVALTAGNDLRAWETMHLRAVPIALGLLTILLLARLGGVLRGPGAIALAGLLAVSPFFTYYHSDFIHETYLALATVLTLGAAQATLRRPTRLRWAKLGACAGLMLATKNTAILFLGAALLVVLVEAGPARWQPAAWRDALRTHRAGLAAGLLALTAVVVLFYSHGFTHFTGLLDYLSAWRHQVPRSQAADHTHPPWQYLHWLAWWRSAPGPAWTEAPLLLLGMSGAALAWRERRNPDPVMRLLRGAVLWSLIVLAVISALPYKTPWNTMTPLLGLTLAGGIAVDRLWRSAPVAGRVVLVVAGLLGLGFQAPLTWTSQTRLAADPRNPWAYGQALPDVERLAGRIGELTRLRPADPPRIEVIAPREIVWPLPWYLRREPRVGYWHTPEAPLAGDLTVIHAPWDADLVGGLAPGQAEFYGILPGRLVVLHIEHSLWGEFIATRAGKQD